MNSISPLSFPESELKQILAFLFIKKGNNQDCWIKSNDISKILLDEYSISIHYRTIDSILGKNSQFIVRKKIRNQWGYRILLFGEEFIKESGVVLIIDPDNPISAISSLHEIMKNLIGDILICDPYLDKNSLNYLDSISVKNKVSLLSQKLDVNGEFKSLILGLRKKGLNIEIRKTTKKILHDRYIIEKDRIYFLGTSLNGIGNKQSFIFKMESGIRDSIEKLFISYWASAQIIVI